MIYFKKICFDLYFTLTRYILCLSGDGKPYKMPTANDRSKRSVEIKEKLKNDNQQATYLNVPLKAGKKYTVLVRAHVDQVNFPFYVYSNF